VNACIVVGVELCEESACYSTAQEPANQQFQPQPQPQPRHFCHFTAIGQSADRAAKRAAMEILTRSGDDPPASQTARSSPQRAERKDVKTTWNCALNRGGSLSLSTLT
jgi:hypothetical protein